MNFLILTSFLCVYFALTDAKGGRNKGGFGGAGKALGGIGKAFNQASRPAQRTVNHAGGAINLFSHQAAHVAERTTNQAAHATQRTSYQAAHVAERATNQAAHVAEHHFDDLRADARHATYATGDGIKHAANEIGNYLVSIDLNNGCHDDRYCNRCRCHYRGCRCNRNNYYWYGSGSQNRRYRRNNYDYYWPSSSSQSSSNNSGVSYYYPSNSPYNQPRITPNRDDEFNRLYYYSRNEKITCSRPTCNERFFRSGNWISASQLEKKIVDTDINEAEYIEKCFYFDNKYQLLISFRESIVNHRGETLKKLYKDYRDIIPEQSAALFAWFFYELYKPFDESAKLMGAIMFQLELDVNVPYNGKTASRYALESLNVSAFEWLWNNGGRFGSYSNGEVIEIRSDVPIDIAIMIEIGQTFDKFNISNMIKFNEAQRQFEFLS